MLKLSHYWLTASVEAGAILVLPRWRRRRHGAAIEECLLHRRVVARPVTTNAALAGQFALKMVRNSRDFGCNALLQEFPLRKTELTCCQA